MGIPQEINKNNKELETAFKSAYNIVNKNYLEELESSSYELEKPPSEIKDIDIANCGRFFRLKKLVLNKEESFLDKLTTIVNVVYSIGCTLVTVISGSENETEYYIGIVSKKNRQEADKTIRDAGENVFEGAVRGNLPGIDAEPLSENEINEIKNKLYLNGACCSSVSGVVALRDDKNKNIASYVQGIENLVDSLKGQNYTVVMIADPVSSQDIQIMKNGYEMIYTQMTAYFKNAVTFNENYTSTQSLTDTTSFSRGISEGVVYTQSTTSTHGKSRGVSFNAGLNIGDVGNIGAGANFNRFDSQSSTDGHTENRSTSDTQTEGQSRTDGSSNTVGKSLQYNIENRAVKSMLKKIDKNIERLEECDSLGAFECAAYVICGSRADSRAAAGAYNALMRGENSNVQASHINTWYKKEQCKIIGEYLKAASHPRFKLRTGIGSDLVRVTPASIMSGSEVAIQIGLPKKSINGVTVIPMAPFGRNIAEKDGADIELGNLYHMGSDEGSSGRPQRVRINVEDLAMHTFVTGSTGSGKTTVVSSMLEKIGSLKQKHGSENIKFMVIEPAKGEYKNMFGNRADVSVYGTNGKKTPLLKINPFSFPDDVHVLEHIDRLIEIFNVCWPMYAAMPAVLKDSVERAYITAGWDLESSVCRYAEELGKPIYPTFADVLDKINSVMNESQYSSDSKGDYKGALCTRVKSLTNGIYAQIFSCDEIAPQTLFNQNSIVDLSRVGSMETKSLIMGLLVLKLQEFRMSESAALYNPLKHITILEEAHNLLKRTSTKQSQESANLAGKSVEMLANSIAEMRAYGEGFIIADQSPELLDMSVIRNTNTKIILRLPDYSDRVLVGKAAGLNDAQIDELAKLNTFVAAVYQNDWLEPVLCHIDTDFKESEIYRLPSSVDIPLPRYEEYIEYLITPYPERSALDQSRIDNLKRSIINMPLSAETKIAFMEFTAAAQLEDIQKLRGRVMMGIFNTDTAFMNSRNCETSVDRWYNMMKANLVPSLERFDEEKTRNIIAILLDAYYETEKGAELRELYNNYLRIL